MGPSLCVCKACPPPPPAKDKLFHQGEYILLVSLCSVEIYQSFVVWYKHQQQI